MNWEPLINANQLKVGSLLRRIVIDVNFKHTFIYLVKEIGELYLLLEKAMVSFLLRM